MLGDESEGNDLPPGGSLVTTLLGRDEERKPSLGEFRAETDRLREWKQEEIEELRAESAVRVR
jgi:hypothetical protein